MNCNNSLLDLKMVHKYTLAKGREQIQNQFGIKTNTKLKPIYNAYPSASLPVITSDNPEGVDFLQWGLIPYDSVDPMIGDKLLHAKIEIIKAKKPFADLIVKQRCLIPADGFIIWSNTSDLVPFRVTLKSKKIFSIAGIWDRWNDEFSEQSLFSTFSMITTSATDSVKPISDRMPAILLPEFESTWLNQATGTNDALDCIKPLADELFELQQINPKIITSEENNQELINELNIQNPGENFSLFQ